MTRLTERSAVATHVQSHQDKPRNVHQELSEAIRQLEEAKARMARLLAVSVERVK